ncbi:MAG: hypothetical protein Q8R82_08720 [Hyphomonadaceae bacterium]|nr:hypothetical protein [Hyphomonadaceae bacterium]
MWFLLLQIFILMLLAAALGAALAWWWLNRRHEDLAASRERLVMQAGRIDGLATRDDLEKELAAMTKLLGEQKPVDLRPMEERMMRLQSAITNLQFPQTDLTPVISRVANVGEAVARILPTDVRPLDERLSRLEGLLRDLKLPEVDLGPVHSGIASVGLAVKALEPVNGRITALEGKVSEVGARLEGARRNDMDTIAGRFTNISTALSSLRIPDMAPVQSRLAELQAGVANVASTLGRLQMPDMAPVHTRLAELHGGMGPVQKSLSDLETFVVALDKPPTDFGPLHSRFAALEAALMAVQTEVREGKALQPINMRIAGLEEALGGMPGPDLEPVLGAVRAIDSRHDLVAVENRLTAIEYGLAAVHHMLRSRADGAEARVAPSLQVVRETPAPVAPVRPTRDSDPINAARRTDDRANLLASAAFGAGDDLELIDGVGPMLASLLNEVGVFYFWQVAEWTPEEIDWVESKLKHFRGRIRRDDWVGHARTLAAGPTAAKRPGQQVMRGSL